MSDEKLYLPKEVSNLLDISTSELKDLCLRIPAIDRAIRRTDGGHRRYSSDDIEALREAVQLKKDGYTYENINEYFEGGFDPSELEIPKSRLEKKVEELIELQKQEKEMLLQRLELQENRISELIEVNKKVLVENKILSERHDNLLTTTINEKQQEKKNKGFWRRIFNN